jgi:AraC-like DNA-binding protein
MIPDRQFWTKPERFWAKNLLSNALAELGTIVIVEGEQLMSAVALSNRFTVPAPEQYAAKSKALLEQNLGVEIRMGFGGITPVVGELRSLYRQSLRQLDLLDDEESTGHEVEFVSRIIRTAMRHMDTDYADPELSLRYLGKRLQLTPNYLSSLFTSETGFTFTQHLSRIRIDRAKTLLRESDLKIYQIGKQVGYADRAYFSRLFKMAVGCSPADYRAANRPE